MHFKTNPTRHVYSTTSDDNNPYEPPENDSIIQTASPPQTDQSMTSTTKPINCNTPWQHNNNTGTTVGTVTHRTTSIWHPTPPRETRKHSQNASSKEPKGSETVPWTRRILQKICPQICRHFKSSNTLNEKGCRIQMDTRVREIFSDTKGILETGTDTQIPRPPSKLHCTQMHQSTLTLAY